MAAKRDRRLEGEIDAFIRQYGRKGAAHDPNDRRYNRKIEELVKNMDPEELYRLVRGEVDDEGKPHDDERDTH